jgi:hypothetical protein
VVFDRVFADTLQITADGRHWACLAGLRGRLFVAVDGAPRRPFDLEELVAAFQQATHGVRAAPRDLPRRWVAAELDGVQAGASSTN